jgi:hypothetical protein
MVQEIALLTKEFGVKSDRNQCGLVGMTYLFFLSLQSKVNLQRAAFAHSIKHFPLNSCS